MVFCRKVAMVAVVFLFPLSTTAFSPVNIHALHTLHTYTHTILRQPTTRRARHGASYNNKLVMRKATAMPSVDNSDIDPIFEPLGVGVKRDFGARLPLYPSDIKDGLNAQTLATTLFLFFACLAPAIGFGGTLGVATGGAMGAIEMVASTAFCGVVYALCAPQPIQL
jgi:hypothetical protein